jgi:hypothetical protein
MTTISNPMQNMTPQVSNIQMEQLQGLLDKIKGTVDNIDNSVKKTVTQSVSEMVFKYFDTSHEYSGLFLIGWFILGICVWLPIQLFNLFLSIIKYLFFFIIFLLIFVPLFMIGLAFAVLIMVLIKIWTLGKTFIEALIPAINSVLPIPITVWNIIANFFNAISRLANKFGGRLPRMPTVNRKYKLKHKLPSIFDIIKLVTTPLQDAAWAGVEEALN